MRPAVHASFLRNRGLYQRRRKRTHVFSPRILLLLVVSGVLLFIPGLALTIIGLQQSDTEPQHFVYQAIGPVMGTIGIVVMFASCIYFSCYGADSPASAATLNSQQQSIDQEEKGSSIRSKQRESNNQLQQSQNSNGGSVDVHTPGTDSKRSSKEDEGLKVKIKLPHRTSGSTKEEDMPLTKMEHIAVLPSGQNLAVPTVAIYIQESSDTEDMEYADDTSRSRHFVRGRVEA